MPVDGLLKTAITVRLSDLLTRRPVTLCNYATACKLIACPKVLYGMIDDFAADQDQESSSFQVIESG